MKCLELYVFKVWWNEKELGEIKPVTNIAIVYQCLQMNIMVYNISYQSVSGCSTILHTHQYLPK